MTNKILKKKKQGVSALHLETSEFVNKWPRFQGISAKYTTEKLIKGLVYSFPPYKK